MKRQVKREGYRETGEEGGVRETGEEGGVRETGVKREG